MKSLGRAASATALVLVTAGLTVSPVHGATADLVVTTLGDTGAGSLRERLAQAAASPEDDRITFAPSMRGEITLTEGQLEVLVGEGSGSLVVEGPGAGVLTVVGNRSRAFDVRGDGSGVAALALSGVTLTGGWASSAGGGGLRAVDADVTLTGVTVRENSADRDGGGIHSVGGLLTVRDSTINANQTGSGSTESGEQVLYGQGGGIRAENLHLVNSRVTDNYAFLDGGGIAIATPGNGVGLFDMQGSAVDHNRARLDGGAIMLGEDDAGVSAQFIGSTIADNDAGDRGGAVVLGPASSLELASATVAGNSAYAAGGVHSQGALTMQSSVLAMNPGGDLVGGGTAVLSRSLLQDSRDSTVADDGLSLREVDPLLGELTDNGGSTPTMLPASNSPVIDAGSSTDPSDQRGSARVVGDAADMGAVEATLEERQGLPQIASVEIPRIIGDVRVGERIATDGGMWSEPSVTLSYQWLADDVPIHRRATDPWFNVGRVFTSDRLSVRVTATAPGFQPATRASDLTDYPLPGTWTVKEPSRVKGATRVGVELRAVRARLSPRATGRTFRWFVGGREVDRAYNTSRLTLRPWMRGKRVKVVFRYRTNGWEELRQVVRKPKRVR